MLTISDQITAVFEYLKDLDKRLQDSHTVNPPGVPIVFPAGNLPVTPNEPQPDTPPVPRFANSTEAFWATQPPEVQVLHTMPVGEARKALALFLASQGHKILQRVHIMGWNPAQLFRVFLNGGRTWLDTVSTSYSLRMMEPGLDPMPGWESYNPVPPEGTWVIDMSFAEGLPD